MNDEIKKIAERFTILNHVPLGVCIIDRNYTVLFWNRVMEEWCGITASDITAHAITERFEHFTLPRYRSRLETIFEGGPPAIFSSQLHGDIFPSRLPNGEPRIQHTIVTAVPSENADGFYAIFAVTDITELTSRILDYRIMRDKALQEIEQRKRTEKEKENLITELKEALNKISTLSDMLPICASCKKIRDDQGYWQQVESYMSQYVQVSFSHSICPDCAKKLYPDFCGKPGSREKL